MNTSVRAYRVVHLQRLANPLLPHDPILNPYRTVDTMPVDLTTFNGRMPGSQPDFNVAGTGQLDSGKDVMFRTGERGEQNDDREFFESA